MLPPALGSPRGIGVSHQAGAVVQPVPLNPSSFPAVLITIWPPGPGEFQGFFLFFGYLEITWVKCFRFQPQAPSLDYPKVKVPSAW